MRQGGGGTGGECTHTQHGFLTYLGLRVEAERGNLVIQLAQQQVIEVCTAVVQILGGGGSGEGCRGGPGLGWWCGEGHRDGPDGSGQGLKGEHGGSGQGQARVCRGNMAGQVRVRQGV